MDIPEEAPPRQHQNGPRWPRPGWGPHEQATPGTIARQYLRG